MSLLYHVSSGYSPNAIIGLGVSTSYFVRLASRFLVDYSGIVSRFFIYLVVFSHVFVISQGGRLLRRLHQHQGYVFYGYILVLGLFRRFRVFCGQVHLYLCLSYRVDVFR